MRNLLTVILVGLWFNGFSISGKEYLDKINANYEELNSFELELNYQLFKGHNGTEIKDEYNALVRKEDKSTYMNLYNETYVSDKKMSLVINNRERLIQIFEQRDFKVAQEDIVNSLDQCQQINIQKKGDSQVISISFKPFSNAPYSRVQVEVDKKFWIKKITLYYETQMNFSTDYYHPDLDVSRLEITHKKLKKNWKDREGLTDLSRYITSENGNYVGNENFAAYEIVDLRK